MHATRQSVLVCYIWTRHIANTHRVKSCRTPLRPEITGIVVSPQSIFYMYLCPLSTVPSPLALPATRNNNDRPQMSLPAAQQANAVDCAAWQQQAWHRSRYKAQNESLWGA